MENLKDKKTDDILEKLVHINRITKVVKGGRRFGFSALVVVGNQAGKIGIAHAKAKQVPDAIKKENEFIEKLVHVNRITKVVKGGRRFGFSALVVVGNQNGKIGIAHAKAKQVPDAIKKANEMARRKLIHIPLREGRTIHHDIFGKDGAGKIKLRSAPKGTGIIAGGPVRAVCEVLGIKDIVAKSLGTANPHNVIRACLKALLKQNSPKNISLLRNKKISEIIEKRG